MLLSALTVCDELFEARERAQAWCETLADEVAELPPGENRDAWQGAVEAHRNALDGMVEAERMREAAVDRARWTALAVAAGALGLGAIFCFGRQPRPNR